MRRAPKGKGKYVLQMDNPYLLLNRYAFEAAGVSEEEAENSAKNLVQEIFANSLSRETTSDPPRSEPPELTNIYTVAQMREGRLPQTQYRRFLAHSYSPYVGWALHLNFGPYQFPWHGSGTTHLTANSYDRHVPLELFATTFVPGTYHGVVAPVDIAATFASVLESIALVRPLVGAGHESRNSSYNG